MARPNIKRTLGLPVILEHKKIIKEKSVLIIVVKARIGPLRKNYSTILLSRLIGPQIVMQLKMNDNKYYLIENI